MSSGTGNVVRFNWPFYVTAALVIAAAAVVAARSAGLIRFLAIGALLVAAYFAFASLLATYVVYDRSGVTRWEWLRDVIPAGAKAIANVHAGFDDSTEAIRRLFPNASVATLLLPDSAEPEPSIERARRFQPAPPAATFSAEPQSLDVILLLLAAHEMREAAQRERFFRDAATALRPDGRIVLVEHLRDAANVLAYGPGALHFYGAGEWRRLAAVSGLNIAAELTLTPFLHGFVLTTTR